MQLYTDSFRYFSFLFLEFLPILVSFRFTDRKQPRKKAQEHGIFFISPFLMSLVGNNSEDEILTTLKQYNLVDKPSPIYSIDPPKTARFIRISSNTGQFVQLCEVEIFAQGDLAQTIVSIEQFSNDCRK